MSRKNHIAVIADDFTGAAEIGGTGLIHGLKVSIDTVPLRHRDIDLQIVAADTRSLPAGEAAEYIHAITRTLSESGPMLIYKKMDSVFRGNVSAELEAQLRAMNMERAVVVAANPALGRVIRKGHYYIDRIPLDRTSFSDDPEYPATSSAVTELLGYSGKLPVISLDPEETLPGRGLIAGNVESLSDLEKWTACSDEKTLMAGAAGFFNALLEKQVFTGPTNRSRIPPFGGRRLFIQGSTFPKDRGLYSNMKKSGHFLSNMPANIYWSGTCPEASFRSWVDEIAGGMNSHGKVVVSSFHGPAGHPVSFGRIKRIMARMVKAVMERCRVDELLIEGGSTASEILRQLDIVELEPLQVRSAGVIRMRIKGWQDCYLTTKPGSYKWPENVWLREEIEKMDHNKTLTEQSHV